MTFKLINFALDMETDTAVEKYRHQFKPVKNRAEVCRELLRRGLGLPPIEGTLVDHNSRHRDAQQGRAEMGEPHTDMG